MEINGKKYLTNINTRVIIKLRLEKNVKRSYLIMEKQIKVLIADSDANFAQNLSREIGGDLRLKYAR